jgi:hypothetical protein
MKVVITWDIVFNFFFPTTTQVVLGIPVHAFRSRKESVIFSGFSLSEDFLYLPLFTNAVVEFFGHPFV